jgi:hypothetical protein
MEKAAKERMVVGYDLYGAFGSGVTKGIKPNLWWGAAGEKTATSRRL